MIIYLNYLWLDKLRLKLHCLFKKHHTKKGLALGQIEVWCKECNRTYYYMEDKHENLQSRNTNIFNRRRK